MLLPSEVLQSIAVPALSSIPYVVAQLPNSLQKIPPDFHVSLRTSHEFLAQKTQEKIYVDCGIESRVYCLFPEIILFALGDVSFDFVSDFALLAGHRSEAEPDEFMRGVRWGAGFEMREFVYWFHDYGFVLTGLKAAPQVREDNVVPETIVTLVASDSDIGEGGLSLQIETRLIDHSPLIEPLKDLLGSHLAMTSTTQHHQPRGKNSQGVTEECAELQKDFQEVLAEFVRHLPLSEWKPRAQKLQLPLTSQKVGLLCQAAGLGETRLQKFIERWEQNPSHPVEEIGSYALEAVFKEGQFKRAWHKCPDDVWETAPGFLRDYLSAAEGQSITREEIRPLWSKVQKVCCYLRGNDQAWRRIKEFCAELQWT